MAAINLAGPLERCESFAAVPVDHNHPAWRGVNLVNESDVSIRQ
jgi:hypothetical protein